ncbi:hypothetical protein AVEN_256448-1 [Araneus ventricosus]|uniref:Uncharacterized protein n=1 Tax=Araneus ventricosus TaxID=182803 RepID=A0A4Y2LNW1_ARAVE|nr:hypothetical protein AVEN_256448-1 [Araneus ventricosus]
MTQTSNDIIVSEEGEFIELNLRIGLNLNVPVKGFLKMPYDFLCPPIKSKLSSRTCGSCGLYHASQKSSNRHKKTQHGEKSQKPCLVRPLRIAARRANELICVIKYVEGMEDAEWLNEEKVYQDSFREESDEVVIEGGSNIITDMEKWLEQPCCRIPDYMLEIKKTIGSFIDERVKPDSFHGSEEIFHLCRIEKKHTIYLSAYGGIYFKRGFLFSALGAMLTYGLLISNLNFKV